MAQQKMHIAERRIKSHMHGEGKGAAGKGISGEKSSSSATAKVPQWLAADAGAEDDAQPHRFSETVSGGGVLLGADSTRVIPLTQRLHPKKPVKSFQNMFS